MKFYVTGDLKSVRYIYVGSIWSLALTHCDLFLQEALFFAVKS